MHTVDYSLITDEQVRHNTAIQDLKIWLGVSRYKQISKDLKTVPGLTYSNLRCNAEFFLGVQGYPIEAWAKELGIEKPKRT